MQGIDSTAQFSATPRSVARARRFVAETLDGHGMGSLGDPAVLCVSDLVSQAVLHEATRLRVDVHVDERGLRVDVSEPVAVPRPRREDLSAEISRGLPLVARIARRHGVQTRDEGIRMWFELPVGDEVA
jgi:hypothetical protein